MTAKIDQQISKVREKLHNLESAKNISYTKYLQQRKSLKGHLSVLENKKEKMKKWLTTPTNVNITTPKPNTTWHRLKIEWFLFPQQKSNVCMNVIKENMEDQRDFN